MNSFIAVANGSYTSKLNIYAQGKITLTNSSYINGDNILMKIGDTVNFNNTSSINKNSTTALTTLYTNNAISFTGSQGFVMGGYGLVVSNNSVNLCNNTTVTNTVFINGGGGSSYLGGTVSLAGLYTNGDLDVEEAPKVANTSAVINKFGIGGGGVRTATVIQGTWKTN